MKRFLFTLISIFCIYTSFGQTVLSGTWIFQYDYFIETGYPLSFPGTKEGESDIRNFDYVYLTCFAAVYYIMYIDILIYMCSYNYLTVIWIVKQLQESGG